MTLNAALWASSTALTGKAALAFWTAAVLFQCFDRRKLAINWQILLSICIVALSIVCALHSSVTVTHWMASGVIACLSGVMSIRQWMKTSPREVYEEASQIDPTNKKKSASKSSRPQALKASGLGSVQLVDLMGLLVAATAISISVYTSLSSQKSYALVGTIHALAACILWGVGVFCAIELTFGSAPASLSAVSWSSIALVALGCWITESCIAASIILSPVDRAEDFQAVAMTRLFAISILLIDFVVWMIPHRVATFKRTGKADAWVSLTMAAWIGMLSLAVLCALPSSWPWQM